LESVNHKEAYNVLKHLIKGIIFPYKIGIPIWLASKNHPYLGHKLNEGSKLAFHLNYLFPAEEMARQAILIFRQYYTLANLPEYKELLTRLQEIQCEIKMTKN